MIFTWEIINFLFCLYFLYLILLFKPSALVHYTLFQFLLEFIVTISSYFFNLILILYSLSKSLILFIEFFPESFIKHDNTISHHIVDSDKRLLFKVEYVRVCMFACRIRLCKFLEWAFHTLSASKTISWNSLFVLVLGDNISHANAAKPHQKKYI